MPRIVKSGLIQMSLPMTEGEGTIKEIMDAMAQLINACTFSKIDANTAPLFDI